MSQPQPIQPNQPQYQISTLDLFPVYTTRAAYQQATGQQAPPFDPTQPLKGWTDPAPTGQPYLVFDSTAVASSYVSQIALTPAQAAQLNLPGVYNYPAYVSPPTDAVEVGPYGPLGPASPDQVCLQADAQAVANQIAPLYPGQTISVVQENTGIFHYVYGLDPRRQWYIQIGNAGMVAQALIEAQNDHGDGAPGHWVFASGGLNWIYDEPVTVAPANALTIPVPIRALLPNEQIVHLPGSLFNQSGSWVVERTDLPQPAQPETDDQQFADLKAMLMGIQVTLNALTSKQ
jgi:hypothetical protein